MFHHHIRTGFFYFLVLTIIIAQLIVPLQRSVHTAHAAGVTEEFPAAANSETTPSPTPNADTPTPTPVLTPTSTPTLEPTVTPTASPTSTSSPPPATSGTPTASPTTIPSLTIPVEGVTTQIEGTPFTLVVAENAFNTPVEARMQTLSTNEVTQLAPHTRAAIRLFFVQAGTESVVEPAAGKVTLKFTYQGFAFPHHYGGEFLKRLRFYEAVPRDNGWILHPLISQNRWDEKSLSTTLENAASDESPNATPTAHLYVVESSPSGDEGDYSATPLTNQKDYQVSLFTGSAATSYTIPVPPPAAGAAPTIRLTYDSGRVDGMSSEKNNQPSWVGTGWALDMGAIVRRMVPCGTATRDLCLTPHYTLTLNGVSSELIPDDQTPHLYHLQDDLHWQVWQRFSDNSQHPDEQGEYWEVITPDGTHYRFGGDFEPNTGEEQHSVLFTPAHGMECGSETGDLCLQKGYRWNLDYVEDTNGNGVSYFYTLEYNYYHSRKGNKRYVRAGYIQHIEYTTRQGEGYQPKGKVVFSTEPRCVGACKWPDDYPDVPNDLSCDSTEKNCPVVPTFWGKKRLKSIATFFFDSSTNAWKRVSEFRFSYDYSDPGNDDTSKKLILTGIQQYSPHGSTLPAVHYDYVLLPNRVVSHSGDSPMPMPRLRKITTELGGQVTYDYQTPQSCPGSRLDVHQPRYCYFTYDPSDEDKWYGWWRYVVQKMRVRASYEQPEQVFTYSYEHPMWHHADSPRKDEQNPQLWSDFRGHRRVTVTDAQGNSTIYTFYQGMDGDQDPSGTPWSSTITLDQDPCGLGAERPDSAGLQGHLIAVEHPGLELTQRSYTTIVTASVPPAAGDGSEEPRIARFIGQAAECHQIEDGLTAAASPTDTLASSPPPSPACPAGEDGSLLTRVDYTYDDYGNRTKEVYRGDLSNPDDDYVIARTFASLPQGYIVDRVAQEGIYAGTQPPSPLTPSGALAFATYGYDVHGNLTHKRQYFNAHTYSLTITSYDTWGRPVQITDPNGNVTTIAYDPDYGYKKAVTNPLGHTTTYKMHPGWGVPLRITDPNGHTTVLQYDAFGRLTKVWLPTEPVSGTATKTFLYHPEARPAYVESRQWVGDTNGEAPPNALIIARTYYDGLGRVIQTRSSMDRQGAHAPKYSVVSKDYDSVGRLARQSIPYAASSLAYTPPNWDSLPGYTTTTYDALGRTTAKRTFVQNQLAFQTITDYCGRWTRITDPNGHSQERATDAFGRLVTVREHNQDETYTTTYHYDPLGRLVQVTDAAGNTISLTYDMLGRKTQMTDPDMGTWLYTYDPAGRLTAQRDGRGQWLYFAYDALGRILSKRKDTRQGTVLAQYTYDPPGALGKLASRSSYTDDGDPIVTITNTQYDARGRVLAQRWVFPGLDGEFRLGFRYNAAGDLLSVTYPGGRHGETGETVSYSYIAHHVNRVWGAEGEETTPYVEESAYNAVGQILNRHFHLFSDDSSPIRQEWEYETGTQRLNQLQVWSPPAGVLPALNLTYTYDSKGNLLQINDGRTSQDAQCQTLNETQTFAYDDLDRLVDATDNSHCVNVTPLTPSSEVNYTYDAIGNLLSRGNDWTYEMDAEHPHAVAQASNPTGVDTFTYDANGNMIERDMGGGNSVSLTYDAQNHLSEAQIVQPPAQEKRLDYLYDDGGQLVVQADKRKVTFFIGPYYEYTAPRIYTVVYQNQAQEDDDGADGQCGKPVCSSPLPSEQVETEPDSPHPRDTTLQRGQQSPLGAQTTLIAERRQGREQSGIVLDFTSLGLPAGAIVQSATLTMMLHVDESEADAESELGVYALHKGWAEETATWSQATSQNAWQTEGANGVPEDRARQAADRVLLQRQLAQPPTAVGMVPVSWDVTDIVSEWVQNPTTQHGFKIMYQRGEGKAVFDSRESSFSPSLVITYTFLDGEQEKRYYLVDGRPVAMRQNGNLYYLFGDHLGSASLALSATGEIVAQQRYLPFGKVRWNEGALPTDRQYTGQRWDEILGLYDYKARYYDPLLARFIQPDTLIPAPGDPQSLNRYAYVRNNPLRYNDPTGHCWGAASFIRGLPGYDVTCNNLDMALIIVRHPKATLKQKVVAAGYIAVEGGAHAALAAGTGALAWEVGSSALLAGSGATGEALEAACADGDCTNEVAAAEEAGLDVFERASEFGIRPYNELRRLIKGTGLQAHHIVEQRFAKVLETKPGEMLSVALKPEEHQVFTNAWHRAIGYRGSLNPVNTVTATAEDIWEAAQDIYTKFPPLLEAAKHTIFGE